MGMFDYYEPVPALVCPFCAETLGGWQGKGAACHLVTWRQLRLYPVLDDECPKEHRLPDGTLPIYTFCTNCKAWLDAECLVENGIWVSTRLELVAPARTP